MEVEYLIIVQQADDFCKSGEAFIDFICLDNNIEHHKNADVKFLRDNHCKLDVQYDISSYDLEKTSERVFDLKILCRSEERIEDFNSLLRKIKKIALKISHGKTQINTIKDDVGTGHALEAYPLIHNIENMMRKLISKFMILNVGIDWSKKALHKDIIPESNDSRNLVTDYIQNLNFIALSDVLFKEYRSIDFYLLDKEIKRSNKLQDLDYDFLKDFVPKSNWERYFSKIIKIEESVLLEKWAKLYELRNDVAHNRFLNKGQIDELRGLVGSITPTLEKAIQSLNEIELSSLDINIIAQSLVREARTIVIDEVSDYNLNENIGILKIAKNLNIGLGTIAEFLNNKGYRVEARPTTKLNSAMIASLESEFGKK